MDHKPDESLAKLTEFAPLSSDIKPVSFFQKLFGKSTPGKIYFWYSIISSLMKTSIEIFFNQFFGDFIIVQ